MKSSKQVEDIVRAAQAKAPPAVDERILTDAIAASANPSTHGHRALRSGPTIWRFIMESRITRYSAAAVTALAAALVLLSPFGSPGNGGIVLADVQQRVADLESVVIRGTKTFTHADNPDEVFEFAGIKGHFDVVKYASKKYGLVEEGYSDSKMIYRITLNLPKRESFLVLPFAKKYGKFPATDGQIRLMDNLSPQGLLKLLLSSEYKELGRSKKDGVAVEGFEFQESEPFKELLPKAVFDIQNVKGRVWIGLEDDLPIWVEGDLTIGKSLMSAFHDLNLHEVNILEKSDVEFDEGIFSTDPPEGYEQITLSDILPLIPAEAKAGLMGLGIAPVGFILWKKRRRKKAATNPG
jgi:hypothetical protein